MGFFPSAMIPTTGLTDQYFQKIQIDFSDKLNWEITVNILVISTVIVTNIRYLINKPISCTVPMHFSSNQEEYANEICFISDKYFVKDNERILLFKNDSSKVQINYFDEKDSIATANDQPAITSYYIFVPYILIIQAFLIILPRKVILKILNINC